MAGSRKEAVALRAAPTSGNGEGVPPPESPVPLALGTSLWTHPSSPPAGAGAEAASLFLGVQALKCLISLEGGHGLLKASPQAGTAPWRAVSEPLEQGPV